ncbi:hypothetical protein BJV78DRAFT_1348636 [Lactifluus subvellereus]|nr:hypothetical protein BJV78DRAFT_1348636 [Lactifluus subvellereus]
MSSAVITPDTKDTPSLTVTINRLSPSSPFPSPGSPFLPPPIPSAHEYALISPASKQTPVVDGPPPERDALGVNSSELSTLNGGPVSTPASPSTPLASSQNPPAADECSTSTTTTTTTTITATTTATAQADTAKSSLDNLRSSRNSLHSSRDSLTSTRPAPPSPATSRRTSAALSRHSSTRSRPGSIAPTTPVDPQDAEQARKASTPPAATAQAILVKIRDFAFPDEDVRHTGTGPLTPRPNRRLQRPLSTWSASSASSAGSSDHDDGAGAGGSSYGFAGWGLGRLSWFGARSTGGPSGDGPSEGDFARNFTDAVSPENEIDDPYESLDDDDDDDDGGGVHRGDRADDYEQDGERPLLPGLYRALYTFEPEGTAEMALEEDQIVRVIGRGGGVGWAIVARGGEEGHALVPEGYLELVSLDRDQVGEEEG